MFSQVSVCSQGGLSALLHGGILEADPPADTPPAQCMLGYSQQAGSTHPTGMHSCFGNTFTVGNLLFWENFLLPECL